MARVLSGQSGAEKMAAINACPEAVAWAGEKSPSQCWAQNTNPTWLITFAWGVADSQVEQSLVLEALSSLLRVEKAVRQSAPLISTLDAVDAFLKNPTPSGYGLLKRKNNSVMSVLSTNTPTEENPDVVVDVALKHGAQAVGMLRAATMDAAVTGGSKTLGLLHMTVELLAASAVASSGDTSAVVNAALSNKLRTKLAFAEASL